MSEKHSTLRRGTEEPSGDEPTPGATFEVRADEAPSERVVAAVAAVSGADPVDIDPLAETVDPDALDALFGDRHDGTPRDGGTVRFPFYGYEVVARGDSRVSVLDVDR